MQSSKQPFFIGGSRHGEDVNRDDYFPEFLTRVPKIRPQPFCYDLDSEQTSTMRAERYIRFEDRQYGTVYVYEPILDDWRDMRFGRNRNDLSVEPSYIFPELGTSDGKWIEMITQCTAPFNRWQVGIFIYFIFMMAGLPIEKTLRKAEGWTYKFFKDKHQYE